MNNIITRGYGDKHRIVTRGYGSFVEQVLDAAADAIRKAGSSAKYVAKDLRKKYVVVRAALIEVNSKEITNIKGSDKSSMAEIDVTVTAKVLISRVYKTLKEIFIRATNVKSSRHRRD